MDMSEVDWLKLRQKGIGGSDVPAILGFSKWKTPLQVYNEKVSESPVTIEQTPRMAAGKKLEATIAEWWAEEYGFKIQNDNKVRIHKDIPFLLGNIDRLILSTGHERGTGILECKNTNGWAFKQWKDDGLPTDFYSQVQHYFNVLGHSWGAVAVLVDGWDLKSIDIQPDREFIKLMTDRLISFWKDHVEKRLPPPPSTNEEVTSLYPKADIGKVLEATQETAELVRIRMELKNKANETEDKLEDVEARIKATMGDAEILQYAGEKLATWKNDKPSMKFNKNLFADENPVLYKQYYTEFPGSRRFIVKS
jgi:putative phage-type endonuclease